MEESINREGGIESPNPIHEEGGKWYFWDETWADRCGPFDTKEQAEAELGFYVRNILGV